MKLGHYQTARANAKAIRDRALKKYYQSPNHCKQCGGIIHPGNQRPADARAKKFCDNSCAAISNNRRRESMFKPCKNCGAKKPKRGANRLYCNACFDSTRIDPHARTKAESIEQRIHELARRAMIRAKTPKKCSECGYSHFVEVGHIKPIKSFPPEALIREINSLENLVYLCPNHHKELDRGMLILGAGKGNRTLI